MAAQRPGLTQALGIMLQQESQPTVPQDEACVALCLYGDSLDMARLSSQLGCHPTHSHKKGELGDSGKPYPTDAWIVEIRQFEPFDLDQMFNELLETLPGLGDLKSFAAGCRSRIDFALHTENGHHVQLSAQTLRRIADLNTDFHLDIYAYPADA